MIRIGIDMMGGDFAPHEAVKGAVDFLNNNPQKAHLVMIGDESSIKNHLNDFNLDAQSYSIVPTTQVIEMHEHPTKA